MKEENHFNVIIIGAGASGLMCAQAAGKRGRNVLVLEHSKEAGAKILVSGGGKCNFTNLGVDKENYISGNPHFVTSALRRFTQHDFISLLEEHDVKYEEREHGQLFCRGSAKAVVNLLLKECDTAGVKIRTGCSVKKVEKEKDFRVKTNSGDFTSESLVIAAGGLSLPESGATALGYKVAIQFGIKVIKQLPGLVPLVLKEGKDFKSLSGISVNASVSVNGCSFRDAVLFTHRGLSGPAILQASNYWHNGDEIMINLLPDIDLEERLALWQREKPRATVKNLLATLLPKRLVAYLSAGLDMERPVSQYGKKDMKKIAEIFNAWSVRPHETEGYRKAEVTRGGIDTNELSSRTFESKKVQRLYFIGEVLDVTGWLGGYNLQWAWSSGYCAGQYI
ncbi:MAG: NAD(P)/FAD-dependent oxidoreductase [bacterium]|nr:NAD(P)/FAD-dependent oxidoreductase [bacterium]